MSIKVYELAHGRAGDKGSTINISVIAYDEKGYCHLEKHLTVEKVQEVFLPLAKGPITCYALPKLKAFNFVIEHLRGGGVTVSLAHDIHGKSLSYLMLNIEVPDIL
jgi:hypothetical protein